MSIRLPDHHPHHHHLLVIGAGSIGERHIRCFLTTRRCRVSFVEIREPLRLQIANKYPDATAYPDLESASR
jgi:predicted dehydrogenase